MKELDVLFDRFVRRALDQLDDNELEALERLLEQPDQDILEWIASPATAPPSGMCRIVALVRVHGFGRP